MARVTTYVPESTIRNGKPEPLQDGWSANPGEPETTEFAADPWFYEKRAREQGYTRIAGVDEAGRGPLAGPVVAAAVILPEDFDCCGIRDSKAMRPGEREVAFDRVMDEAIAVGIGAVGPEVIDEMNILRAAHRAMKAALDNLNAPFDFILVDGLPVAGLPTGSLAVVRGDCKSASIMAASIVAKVTRDRIMVELDRIYPGYG
ncbi:MAG: ribonuclease HII, partial [Armatimonadota bacterium]